MHAMFRSRLAVAFESLPLRRSRLSRSRLQRVDPVIGEPDGKYAEEDAAEHASGERARSSPEIGAERDKRHRTERRTPQLSTVE